MYTWTLTFSSPGKICAFDFISVVENAHWSGTVGIMGCGWEVDEQTNDHGLACIHANCRYVSIVRSLPFAHKVYWCDKVLKDTNINLFADVNFVKIHEWNNLN